MGQSQPSKLCREGQGPGWQVPALAWVMVLKLPAQWEQIQVSNWCSTPLCTPQASYAKCITNRSANRARGCSVLYKMKQHQLDHKDLACGCRRVGVMGAVGCGGVASKVGTGATEGEEAQAQGEPPTHHGQRPSAHTGGRRIHPGRATPEWYKILRAGWQSFGRERVTCKLYSSVSCSAVRQQLLQRAMIGSPRPIDHSTVLLWYLGGTPPRWPRCKSMLRNDNKEFAGGDRGV